MGIDAKERIIHNLLEKGYSLNSAKYYGSHIYDEWHGKLKDDFTLEEKKWAYSKGYLAERAKIFQLNESNYKDYINDEDYYILDPIDPVTKRLVDGKLTIHYTIGGKYPEYMPIYYAWIDENSRVIQLDDNIPLAGKIDIKSYLEVLLDKVGIVAIKPLAGAGGIGFLKLEKIIGGGYLANGKNIDSLQEIVPSIDSMYVVTEYIKQCKEFDAIWKDSAATLRVIALNIDQETKVFVSYVRFGTNVSKGACNLTSGGVAAPFDWETGYFYGDYYRYLKYCQNGEFKVSKHPDSGVSIQGKQIPHFDKVKNLVNDLSRYLAVHKYFGFDIIITDEGAKICEINSHPSIDYEQLMHGGIWKRNDEVSDFFRNKLKEKKGEESFVFIPDEFNN